MRSKLFGRLMSFTLSATVALTSGIPALAYDGGGGDLPEEELEILDLEEEDLGSDFDVVEEGIVEDEEFSFEEVEDEAEFEAYEDSTITISTNDGATSNALFYTVKDETITALAAGSDGTIKFNSDYGCSFYVVPKAGYELPAAPIKIVEGKFTAKTDATAVEFSSNDFTVTPMTDEEKSFASTETFSIDGTVAVNKPYWSKGVKVTVKGGTDSYFGKLHAAQLAKETGFNIDKDVKLAFSDTAASAIKYKVPVYKYDQDAEGAWTISASGLSSGVTATYGTAILQAQSVNIYGALPATEWANYTPKVAFVTLDADGNKMIQGEIPAASATEEAATGVSDGIGYYFKTTEGTTVKATINAWATTNGYINAQNNGSELAIILVNPNEEAAAGNKITTVSEGFAKFYYGTGNTEYDGTQTRANNANTVVLTEKTADGFSVIVPTDKGENALEKAKGKRSLHVYKTIGDGDESEVTYTDSKYTIAAAEGDLVIRGVTTEVVTFTEVGYATANKIVVRTIDDEETLSDNIFATDGASKDVNVVSGKSIKFTVDPEAGYDINGVTFTQYNTAAEATVINNRTLTPDANGVYAISNVTGYVEVSVATKELQDTLAVKLAGTEGFKAYDYRTKIELTTSGAYYAVAGESYRFAVDISDGYKLGSDGVTAKVIADDGTKTDLSVTAGSKGVYSLTAPAAGVIEITVNAVKMIDAVKIENKYAQITVNGNALGDGETAQLTANKKVTISATGLNGAEINKVYIGNAGTNTSTTGLTEVTKTDGVYVVPQATASTYGGSTVMYIYVLTTRDAVAGTEFTAKFINDVADDTDDAILNKEDVTSGIALFADGSNETVPAINSENESKITAVFKIGDDEDFASKTATTYETATKKANTEEAEAGVEEENRTKVVATASTTEGVATINPQSQYSGGTDAYVTDTLTATYTVAAPEGDWMNGVTYTASLPVTVYPLRSFYKKTHENLIVGVKTAVGSGVAKDEIRSGSNDAITLDVEYDAALAENGVNASKASGNEIAANGIKWSVTPVALPQAAGAEYKVNEAFQSAVTADTLKISDVKKVQNLTATAEISFVDGTQAEVSKVVKAVENDLGYFAIPTTTVNGVETVNGTAIVIETTKTNKTNVNSATVKYDVYHVLSAEGIGYLTSNTALNSEDAIETAITAKKIEKVSADKVTWVGITGTATDYADNYTISGSAGAYTVTAKAKADADALKLEAKVGNYTVLVPTGTTVKVDTVTARYTVTIFTGDADASTDYKNPVFTSTYISGNGNKTEEVLADGKITSYKLTDIAKGSKITLPSVSAFDASTIDPKRSLAGWEVGTLDGEGKFKSATSPVFVAADGTVKGATIEADTIAYKAIWAPKYSATTSDNGIAFASAGTVKAYNYTTKEALTTAEMAMGTEIPVTVGFYELDPTKEPTAEKAFYSSELTLLDPATLGNNLKVTSTSAEAEKFVTTSEVVEGTTTYTFTGNKLTPKTEATTVAVPVIVTWKDEGVTAYTAESFSMSIVQANVWEFEMDPVVIEAGQTKDFAFKTFKVNNAATDLSVTANFKTDTVKLVPANEEAVEITQKTAADNTFTFKGLQPGTTTATFSFTDVYGTEKSYSVPVTVKTASYSVVAEYTPAATENELVTPKAVKLAEGETVSIPVGLASALALSISNADDFEGTVTFAVTDKGLTYEDDETGLTDADIAVAGDSPNFTVTPSKWGRAYALVTMTVTPTGAESASVYERIIPVESYGMVKVYGPTAGTENTDKIAGDVYQKNAFKVYTDNTKKTEITAGKFAVIPVKYDPEIDITAQSTDKIVITEAASFVAEWIDETHTQTFLGFGTEKAKSSQTAAAVLAGKNYEIPAQSYNGTAISGYAYFKTTDITLNGGYNKVIDLSDEDITTEDQTYKGAVTVNVAPKASATQFNVYGDKAGIIKISATAIEDTANAITGWTGESAVEVAKGAAGDTYREDKFYIAKAAGKVGTVNLTLVANGEKADTITVYANGEYTDGGKTYYMYRGETLKNSYATVAGKTHFYDENGELVKGEPFYIEDEGKWVLVAANGDQITTKGITVLNSKSYYIDGDGFILTGLFNGLVTSGTKKDSDKTYYADPETAALTISDIAKLEDGVTRYFDANGYMATASASADEYEAVAGTDYYVNADGAVALGGIFKVAGKDRLFRDNYKIVKYTDSDVVDGKITVNGTDYTIAEDDTATEDKLFEVASKAWTWTKSTDGKSFVSAKVVFTATDGRTKEITVPVSSMTVTTEGELTKYVATASFTTMGTEVTAKDTKYLDAEGNEVIPHDHVWTPEWKWTAVEGNVEQKVAVLTLTCKVDAENPHTETFSDTITAKKTGTTWNWTASFTYDGQTFTDSKTEFKNNEGEEVPVQEISGELYIVGIDDEYGYGYTGSAIKPNFQVMELRENEEGTYEYWLVNGVDYKASFKNNTKVNYSREKEAYTGNPAEIKIEGKGNYSGKATSAQFKIVDPKEGWEEKDLANLKGAKLALSDTKFTYNGEEQFPKTITLTKKGGSPETYTWDEDEHTYKADGEYMPYPWAVSNNRKKGTATLTLWGSGNTKAKKNFTIAAAELTTGNLKIKVNGEESGAEVLWAAKGAVPDWVEVYMTVGSGDDARDVYLVEGEDYKLSYKNNKALGTATLTVTGKGNTKKSVKDAASFTVTAFDLSAEYVWIQGIQATAGKNVKKVTMAIADTSMQHNLIPSKYYDIVVTDMDEKAVTGNLAAGEYLVKAVAKAGTPLTGETEARHITVANDLSKAKVKVASGFFKTFTGDGIWLTDDDMKNVTVTLKINGSTQTLVYGEDFYISGYRDNVKKGTMTVTIQGTENADDSHGAISGSKTFKVKIKAKALGTAKQ